MKTVKDIVGILELKILIADIKSLLTYLNGKFEV